MSKHLILRQYIALARNEHYTESEAMESIAKDFRANAPHLSGKEFESKAYFPTVQINWTENEKFTHEVCAALNLTDQNFFGALIIPKPSYIENLVYSSELRRIYGLGTLRFMDGFDRDGNFILPKGNGYLMPNFENGLITNLQLFGYGTLRKKAA